MPSRPPQPPLDRWFSSEQAMGLAASILIGLVTVMGWATAWSDWHSYAVLKTYEETRNERLLKQADLISGSLIGIGSAWFAFRWYHLPIGRGSGWAWGPRSKDRAFGIGVGIGNYADAEGWGASRPSGVRPSERLDVMDANRTAYQGSGLEPHRGNESFQSYRGNESGPAYGAERV